MEKNSSQKGVVPVTKKVTNRKKMQAKKDLVAKYYDNADMKMLFNYSDSALAKLRKAGKLPYTKIGGKIVYLREDIDMLLSKNKQNAHILNSLKNVKK